MGQEATESERRALIHEPRDLDEVIPLRVDPRPMFSAVDFHEQGQGAVLTAHKMSEVLSDGRIVSDDFEIQASPGERRGLKKTIRHDGGGIGDVIEAVGEKVLGLMQGRDGDSLCASIQSLLSDGR